MRESVTIYVVKTSLTGEEGSRARYSESFRGGYRIEQTPQVGDVILDVLKISRYGENKIQVSSQAAWGQDKRLELASTWNWGDQYEIGAEIEGRDACLSALFYSPSDSPHYGVANLESAPTFPLTWSVVDCLEDEASAEIHGEFWPAAAPAN